MLKLRNVAPAVTFRADLPGWMEPKGAAYLLIEARPAGRINTAFMAAQEEIVFARKIEGEDDVNSKREFGRAWIGMLHDTCVLRWETNLINDETGEALTCDRATFVELAEVRVAEISKAFLDFQTAVMEAGERAIKEAEATVKN
jgi:hypothetical protein